MRALSGLSLVGCALSLALTVAAVPAMADEPAPVSDPTSRERALEALTTVEEILDEPTAGELTTALVELSDALPDLPAAERTRAEEFFARPTDASVNPRQDFLDYPAGLTIHKSCGTFACVHWAETGQHAPPGADGSGATIPPWVSTTLQVVEQSWRSIVVNQGYRRPTGDGTRGGGVNLLDVYLGQIGDKGYYGYANIDHYPGRPRAGYLVLDNDFAEFAQPPLNSLRVTAAHEFFHTVQLAYLLNGDRWLMEATATWMEETVYDSINDNRQYLRMGIMTNPAYSLDQPGYSHYGNWIFFQYLSERYGRTLIRDIWNQLGTGRFHAMQAIDRALKARGTSLATQFVRFSAANTAPARHYSEGGKHPSAKVRKSFRLSKAKRTIAPQRVRIDHLSSVNHTFRPGPRLGKGWGLRVAVKAKSKSVRARVLVHHKNGKMTARNVTIRKGTGKVRVPFRTRAIKRVTVAIANTSHAYSCGRGTAWTCAGTPKRERRPASLVATVVR